ncbi:MAG: rod shape-determining protein RodA [Candidatus Latescibacteria bacterium]|nr:rod shape-determining protein RodA [Candidatus Latescibacterota bacterium]
MNLSLFVRRDLDIGLFTAICLGIGVGITTIYSASYNWDLGLASNIYEKQIIWALLGFIVMIITMVISLKLFYAFAYVLYGLTVTLLILVLELGDRRWFNIGPIHIQPSEFAKITTVLVLARFLAYPNRDLTRARSFIPPLLLVLVPILLVFKQPDLGTALVFSILILPMYFWAGVRPVHLFFLISPALTLICAFHPWMLVAIVVLLIGILFFERPRLVTASILLLVNLAVAIIAPYIWENKLHDYQKRRILTFLDPDMDKLGAGYQVIQSKIAIGSGGLTGKGFLEGTQTKLAFLPEQHTDFIFSVICEEFGFIGAFFVLTLFIFILWRALSIAVQTKSRFSSLTAIGLATILLFHIFVNIGMTIGIMPVTGLPLPFLSYGGSTLITNMVLIGLLLNIYANRYEDY